MPIWKVIILGIIQGLTELLPVSSSAHVILAEKLLGLDPSSPYMTFLLITFHTGTMFAVVVYLWPRWTNSGNPIKKISGWQVYRFLVATALTGIVGLGLKKIIEKVLLNGQDIEVLFSNLYLISGALLAAGVLIIFSGLRTELQTTEDEVSTWAAAVTGLAQGLCLPFRGLSRSGTTISVLLLMKTAPRKAEEFSFLLAVILTPPVIIHSALRLTKSTTGIGGLTFLIPIVVGLITSFVSGLIAMKWLSRWLEGSKWSYFGGYCLFFSAFLFAIKYFEFIT